MFKKILVAFDGSKTAWQALRLGIQLARQDIGAIVCALVVAVVTVTASAENALPPLTLAIDWALLAAALGALVAASAAGAASKPCW